MKRHVTIWAWLLVLALVVLAVCGFTIGLAVGKADTCSGWSGRYFQFSNCGGYQCQGISFGPFYTNSCTDPQPYIPPNAAEVQP